jgi:ribose transport system ATP-binding protein
MSHRIVVMCEGRITGELSSQEATQEKIMVLATERGDITSTDTGSGVPVPAGS